MGWIRAWDDDQRNTLLNSLEQIDLTVVNEFIDRVAQLKWK